MPQMAPINWLSLFITFIIALLVFASMNYFIMNYSPSSFSSKKSKLSINWKW